MKKSNNFILKKIAYSALASSMLSASVLTSGCASTPRNYSNSNNTPALTGNINNSGANVGVTFQFYNFHDLGEAVGSYLHGFFRPFRKEFWTSCDSESWAAPFYGRNYAKDHRAETAGDDSRYLLILGGLAKILCGSGSSGEESSPVVSTSYHHNVDPAPTPDPNPNPNPDPYNGGYMPGNGGNVGQ